MLQRLFKVHLIVVLTLVLAIPGGLSWASKVYAASGITIDAPADGATVEAGMVRISGTYTQVYELKLFIGGSRQVDVQTYDPDGDNTGTWHYDFNTSGYSGSVQLNARGLDVESRYGVWSPVITLNVNNASGAAPQVTIVSPSEGVSLSGIVPVRVRAAASNPISKVEVRINGGAWQEAVLDGAEYKLDWDTKGIGDKTSSIEARAFTKSGKKGSSLTTYAKVGAGTNETLKVENQDRSMWMWEAATYNILMNPGSRDVLDAMLKDTETFGSDPVKVLYFAVGPYGGMDILEDGRDRLRDFIAWAHERGYQVQACIAGGTSPPFLGAYQEYHDVAIAHMEQVLNYNISSAPNERFDGLNVDIEPYISPDFKLQYPSLQIQYLDLMERMMERRNATGLNVPIGPAIPKWYDTSDQSKEITWKGETKWLSEHVQDITDYISIMDYRDTADGSAGIIAGAAGEIAYANKIGKPNSVVIGVETLDIANSGDPETITFREEGRRVMEQELDKVYTAFANDASFGGIAMHHYDSIRWLPSHWGPDGVFWEPPADSEPPTAVTVNPTAAAQDYQTVTLSYGRAYDNGEIEKYLVYRSTTPEFTPSPELIAGTSRSLSFKDVGLLPNTTYYYKVAAIDLKGNIGPASAQAKATTGHTDLKPMIISSMQIVRGATNAAAHLTVVDKDTRQPLVAEVNGRFTFAGGKYVGAFSAANGKVSVTSEQIPSGYQIGFEPRRVAASGYYWAQAYDIPHTAAATPRTRLSQLTLSTGALNETFSADKAHYTASVPANETALRLTPTAEKSGTTIAVNGRPVASGSASALIPLQEGENRIVIQTFGPDSTTDSYTVTINRSKPVDNVFAAAEDAYVFQNSVSANYGSEPMLDIVDIPNASGGGDRMAYLKFDLRAYTEPLRQVTLNVYAPAAIATNVDVTVAGYDADNWSEGTINWTNKPTAPSAAKIGTMKVKQAGWYSLDVTSFVQMQTDGIVTFRLADETTKNTKVQFYSKETPGFEPRLVVNPSSDATLADLKLAGGTLTPAFDPAVSSYTVRVPNATASVKVLPTATAKHSVIQVNGIAVSSGALSADIPLAVGENDITVSVKAQDGTLRTYTVTVIRDLPNNTKLASLQLMETAIAPAFSPDIASYSATVSADVYHVSVAALSEDPLAKVTVNGTPLDRGSEPYEFALNWGDQDIVIGVEAQNGDSDTYLVRVTRKLSDRSDLASLQLSGIELAPSFTPDVSIYGATVSNSVYETLVKAAAGDPLAQVTVNGVPAGDGREIPVALQTGSNQIEIKVTPHDGSAGRTYTVVVNREESGDAALGKLTLWAGGDELALTPAFDPQTSVYTVSVPYRTAEIYAAAETAHPRAELKLNGAAAESGVKKGPFPISVGSNSWTADVTAPDGHTVKTYEVRITRESEVKQDDDSSSGSTGSSSGGGIEPSIEPKIENNGVIVRSEPVRSMLADGRTLDTVALSYGKLSKALEQARSGGLERLTLTVAAGSGSQADVYELKLDEKAVEEIAAAGSTLVLAFPGTGLELPASSLEGLKGKKEGIQVRVDQLTEKQDGDQTLTRLLANPEVRRMTAGSRPEWIGTPVRIETNFTGVQSRLQFPLEGDAAGQGLKGDEAQYAVYVEHSDGEKVVKHGKVAAGTNGQPASVQIQVSKFSTFTVLRLPQASALQPAYIAGYEDGTFRPGQAVTRAELASMLVRLSETQLADAAVDAKAIAPADLDGHWSEKEMSKLIAAGIMEGYEDGTFRPDRIVSRGELAALLGRWSAWKDQAAAGGRSEGSGAANAAGFRDIAGHWAEASILAGSRSGWLQGYPDGTFRAGEPVTRAEAVTAMNRLLGRTAQQAQGEAVWPDVPADHWAAGEIWAASRSYPANP
ncbi:S-layer homology domain-containing protein [Paenibacillus sp. UNCCL117]|uniref:cadherin-like beta sandwich domain-containing protein n=1 Tax=unclassified Paenibacillus TaxID=185978 RepID=UPI00088C2FC2|nr:MULTISPECIES: cadherin-like beta sandwich domain-containing protein [unclassified Paenibacillus]SDC23203.1 S-layer homology domain-containing protein [Paenibacillus sp. cl123]SFW19242.1 S-layer homology domain-containing protein [Paenibacillus sp. UNCCL117]